MTEARILKIETCHSLSGRSALTYHVGHTEEGGICLRIWDTNGKGVFSKEWVSADDIHKLLATTESVGAKSMLPLFKVGRSVNTGGFLLAALKNEGLVTNSPEQPHWYVAEPADDFNAQIAQLIDAGTNLDPQAVPSMKKRRRGSRGACPIFCV